MKKIKLFEKIKGKIKKRKDESLDKSPVERDYEKNLDRLRRQLTIRLLSGVLGTTLLLIFIFSTVSMRDIENTLDKNTKLRLERSRDQGKEAVKDYYLSLEREMKKDIKNGLISLERNEDSYRILGIDELALFDSDYRVLYQSSTRDLLPIKKEVKAIKFQTPFYIDKMKIDNDRSYQHLYYKIFKENGREEYLYYKLNNTHLNKILLKFPYKADILNDEFYITASNRELESREYVIDDINKKMLDGRVGEEIYEGRLYSYTYIDLAGESMYLKVYEDLSVYRAPLIRYKSKVYLLWVISVVMTLSVIFFIRVSIEAYADGVSRLEIEKEKDKKYKFLKGGILEVFDELDDMKISLDKLNILMENLGDMKEKVISQNTHIIQKKKDDEAIIEKLIKDNELKKKIKEKL